MLYGELKEQRNAPEVRAYLQSHVYEIKGSVVCFYVPGSDTAHTTIDLEYDECDCPVGRHGCVCPHLVAARIVMEQDAERRAA
jgi:uncharacterized Zn finger protein